MSLPQLYFSRQELRDRAVVPEDVLRYWIRAGLLRPEHGGGKGRHWRFSRLELAVAVLLGELRTLGLSSAPLSELADELHGAIDWMRERRIDVEQASQISELVNARAGLAADGPESWSDILDARMRDDWFDLPPSLVRLAGSVNPEEWRRHHRLFDLLADVSVRRCPSGETHVWLARSANGRWTVRRNDEGDAACIRLSVPPLNDRSWSGERE